MRDLATPYPTQDRTFPQPISDAISQSQPTTATQFASPNSSIVDCPFPRGDFVLTFLIRSSELRLAYKHNTAQAPHTTGVAASNVRRRKPEGSITLDRTIAGRTESNTCSAITGSFCEALALRSSDFTLARACS